MSPTYSNCLHFAVGIAGKPNEQAFATRGWNYYCKGVGGALTAHSWASLADAVYKLLIAKTSWKVDGVIIKPPALQAAGVELLEILVDKPLVMHTENIDPKYTGWILVMGIYKGSSAGNVHYFKKADTGMWRGVPHANDLQDQEVAINGNTFNQKTASGIMSGTILCWFTMNGQQV